jgi:DUF4097 and DUF4098 domain-containing protein YvlB
MNKRTALVIFGVFGALLAVCALCTLTVYSTFGIFSSSTSDFRFIDVNVVSTQLTEFEEYAARDNLVIRSDAGSIQVTAADVSGIEVEMVKTGWGANETEAREKAEAIKVEAAETGSTLTLTYNMPGDRVRSADSSNQSVDFIIKVPQETAVSLHTHFGSIELEGTVGDADLETEFGGNGVIVVDLVGSLDVTNAYADIEARNVDAGDGHIVLNTSFGSITTDGLAAGRIDLETNNGDLHTIGLDASESLDLKNRFGEVHVTDFSAPVMNIDNRNGEIRLEDGAVVGTLEVSNSFGNINLDTVSAAEFKVQTTNGTISMDGGSGLLELETSFGSIEARNIEAAVLQLTSSNGSIRFNGSLDPDAAHSVTTSFGDIELELPEGSAFDLRLETSFGSIDSEFRLSTSSSSSSPGDNRLEGAMNGGGPLIQIETSNGDIRLLRSDS